jgi:hypothetical protein
MGMTFTPTRDSRALTLCPLPRAGEGNGLRRAACDGFVVSGVAEWA